MGGEKGKDILDEAKDKCKPAIFVLLIMRLFSSSPAINIVIIVMEIREANPVASEPLWKIDWEILFSSEYQICAVYRTKYTYICEADFLQ